MRRRKWHLVAAIALLATVAGCASAPVRRQSSTGVLTGTAQACAGLGYVAVAHLAVYRGDAAVARNEVYQQVVPVARKQVPTNGTYRFDLPAGHYFITNTGDTEGAHPFVISGGSIVRLNVPNTCR